MDYNKIQIQKETVILKDGEEVARLKGYVEIVARDYKDILPIEIHYVTKTYQIDNIIQIHGKDGEYGKQ